MSNSETPVKTEEKTKEKTLEDYHVFCKLAAFQLYLGSARDNLRALQRLKRNEDKMYHLEFGVASPIYHFLQRQLFEWGKDGHHLVPSKDDIEKFGPTLLFNKQQVNERELNDYNGNKFPIHKSRELKKEDLNDIEEDLDKWVCDFKEKLDKHKATQFRDEQHRRFNLEFGLVSGLYYRLQRHLIDWGIRSHHPDLDSVATYYDSIGAKFNDEPIRENNVLSVETYEVTREEEEEAIEAEAKEEEAKKDEVCQQPFLLSKTVDEDENLQCIPM